jgi:hypothetical protein
MLHYQIDGVVLTLRPIGNVTPEARQATYDAIAADSRVPDNALVLIDARQVETPLTIRDVEVRARTLVASLGPKLGRIVAVIAPPQLAREAEHVQGMSAQLGVQMAVFRNEEDAMAWLGNFGA